MLIILEHNFYKACGSYSVKLVVLVWSKTPNSLKFSMYFLSISLIAHAEPGLNSSSSLVYLTTKVLRPFSNSAFQSVELIRFILHWFVTRCMKKISLGTKSPVGVMARRFGMLEFRVISFHFSVKLLLLCSAISTSPLAW